MKALRSACWLALIAAVGICSSQCLRRTAIDPGSSPSSDPSPHAAQSASSANAEKSRGCGAVPEGDPALVGDDGSARKCALHSEHVRLPRVTVRPGDNLAPLLLWVYNAPVVLRPSDDPRGVWLVEVLGPLLFRGAFRFPEDEWGLLVGTKAAMTLADGVVQLTAGARVSLQQVQGDQIACSVRVAQFEVDRVSIPCSQLTLLAKLRWDPNPQGVSAGWTTPTGELALSPRAGAPPSVKVRTSWLMAGSKPDARGWVQIVGGDIDGRIVGWTPAAGLVWKEPDRSGGGLGMSGMGEGGCGCGCGLGLLGSIGCLGGCKKKDPERAYEGVATTSASAEVYAEPGRGEWARIQQQLRAEVSFRQGAPWGKLLSLEGVGVSDKEDCCPKFDHAWIRRTAVRFADE